jgi:hypothetical protein
LLGTIIRSTLADALHQAGSRAKAESLFRETEKMQAELQPDFPLLYSLRGFQFCDLLLAAPEHAAWRFSVGFQTPGSGSILLPGQPSAGELSDEPAVRMAELQEACRAIEQRATQTLQWSKPHLNLLDDALNHLTLGRAALYAWVLGSTGTSLSP